MQVWVKLKIYGRVQGVFYRQSAREKAQELGLSGWVRNLPDGAVEAEVCGERTRVGEFTDWCRKGPSYAHVEKVDVEDQGERTISAEGNPLDGSGKFEVR